MKPTSPQRGVNAARTRDHNRQLILGHVHASGSLGRAELARRSGLTTQAVSNIIAGLENEGLLRPKGLLSGKRGLPAIQYVINPEGAYAFGAEIRSSVLQAALVDLTGEAAWQRRLPLPAATPDAVTEALGMLLGRALRHVPAAQGRLLGAGIVMPGPFGMTGLGGTVPDLPGWEEINPAAFLGQALNTPVTVGSAANAAAISERVVGMSSGLSDFACLHLDTGLGLGVVSEGRLFRGAFGNAGAIGHVQVATPDGVVALEMKLSCLSAQRAMAGAGIEAHDVGMLQGLFEDQNPTLTGWLDAALDPLSQAIGMIENMLDPQTIVLCGAMPEPMVQYLIDRVVLPDRSVARRPDRTHPPLRLGRCNRMTATIGAAALVLNQTLTPTPAN